MRGEYSVSSLLKPLVWERVTGRNIYYSLILFIITSVPQKRESGHTKLRRLIGGEITVTVMSSSAGHQHPVPRAHAFTLSSTKPALLAAWLWQAVSAFCVLCSALNSNAFKCGSETSNGSSQWFSQPCIPFWGTFVVFRHTEKQAARKIRSKQHTYGCLLFIEFQWYVQQLAWESSNEII